VKEIRTADQFLQDVVDWGERAARHISNLTRDQFLVEEKTQHSEPAK
jgi:uncharacterized protein with HEPN domain